MNTGSKAYDLASAKALVESPTMQTRMAMIEGLCSLLQNARRETAYTQMEHDCMIARQFANNGDAIASAIQADWLKRPV